MKKFLERGKRLLWERVKIPNVALSAMVPMTEGRSVSS